jgi:hypothetical protein
VIVNSDFNFNFLSVTCLAIEAARDIFIRRVGTRTNQTNLNFQWPVILIASSHFRNWRSQIWSEGPFKCGSIPKD